MTTDRTAYSKPLLGNHHVNPRVLDKALLSAVENYNCLKNSSCMLLASGRMELSGHGISSDYTSRAIHHTVASVRSTMKS